MSFFITNQDKLVKDTINNVLPSCDALFFLVGYFYFSGFQLLYKNISLDQKLKILVGLQAESRISSYIEFSSSQGFPSAQERRRYWYYSLRDILGHSSEFDSQENYEAFNLFVSKLKNGTLEVRQTKNPCHAKMYIFKNSPEFNQKGEFIGTTIVGSSNLSANGLGQNFEINVQHKDNPFVKESLEIFDGLWKESQVLADINTLPELETELFNKIWLSNNPSPFLVYLKVLIEYFDTHKIDGLKTPRQILGEGFNDLQYQVDAIEQGVRSVKEHNGVIVADVVGLGKSIIATSIAANLNLPVLVIAPPHLKPQWEEYCMHLDVNSKVFSSGKIESALQYAQKLNRSYLVVLDEAHNYRNPDTQDYNHLETLCRGNKVIILSATPFNNKPEDIFALINLFQIPGYSTLKSVNNLSKSMRGIIDEYKKIKENDENKLEKYKNISKQIRNIIKEVVIRRNRKDLEFGSYKNDLLKKGIDFPKIADPQLLEYSFGDFSDKYIQTLEMVAGEKSQFKAAKYRVLSYVKEIFRPDVEEYISVLGDPQSNNANFLKRLLVRRLESSVHSFNKTLDNIIESSEQTLSFFQIKNRALISKKTTLSDLEDLPLHELNEDKAEYEFASNVLDEKLFLKSISHLAPEQEEELVEKGIYLIHKDLLKPDFEEDLKNDIRFLKKLQEDWSSLTAKNDRKLALLKEQLYQQFKKDPKRKIILFSEFTDTISYLEDNLPKNDGIIKLISYDASRSPKIKKEIRANFDASFEERKDDYNFLLATDALSEGINLNLAGTIINYDIPYNPTRVIQRVGRINRINKKVFDELYIYNFFPTEIGEEEIKIKQISKKKITIIDEVFREDTRYLTSEETIKASLLHKIEDEEEPVSWERVQQEFLNSIKNDAPSLYQQAKNLPSRVRIARKTDENPVKGVLVFGRRADVAVFSFYDFEKKSISPITDEEAIKLFTATQTEKALPVSDLFYEQYEEAQKGLKAQISEEIDANWQIIKKINSALSRYRNSHYLKLLQGVVGSLSKAKLKIIQKALNHSGNDISHLESQLKKSIPLEFLENLLQIKNQVEKQQKEISIILSTEFTK